MNQETQSRRPRAGVTTILDWRRTKAKTLPCQFALPDDPHTFVQVNALNTRCCDRPDCRKRKLAAKSATCRKRRAKKGQSANIRWDPTDRLDWLLRAGWGSVPQNKIPADVMEAAEQLRMPRLKPGALRII